MNSRAWAVGVAAGFVFSASARMALAQSPPVSNCYRRIRALEDDWKTRRTALEQDHRAREQALQKGYQAKMQALETAHRAESRSLYTEYETTMLAQRQDYERRRLAVQLACQGTSAPAPARVPPQPGQTTGQLSKPTGPLVPGVSATVNSATAASAANASYQARQKQKGRQ